ncbi:MAG: hypothetical protein AABX11_01305 [Nanoarchaeota archaeon]
MDNDSFLDTNIIVNYANYKKDISNQLITRCYLFILNKKGKFIVCHAVIRELGNIMTKLSVAHREVLKKIENNSYSLNESKNLSNRDLPFVEKLYSVYKNEDKRKVQEIFASEREIFEIEIERFLKNKIDLKVIDLEQIKVELVNALRDVIDNYPDCQIIASALQYQSEQKEVFLFVTADGKDLNPNHYEYVKDYGILKDYKFPELLNLMFTK